ncbi:MAG: hypothetical protein ACJA2M_002621 [Polaribacter sp.]|jgi:hypothetical protein
MNKLIELNKLLKRFNFTTQDLTEFEDHIEHTLKNVPASRMKIEKGIAIYRCRKYSLPPKSLFCFESDLSFRTDLNNISEFGRCNKPNTSVFYGSTSLSNIHDKPQMIDPGFSTALLETTKLLDPPKSSEILEGVEIYGVGMWEATEDFDVFIMPPNEAWREESKLAKKLLEIHEENMIKTEVSDEIREFYKIMGSEFSKYMHNKPNEEYGISALFSNHTVKSAGGVAYSSVKAEHNGLNLALTPDNIDRKFNFKRAGIAELWKFGKDIHIHFTKTAERNEGIPLVYNKVEAPECSLENMINLYKNKGIDTNHIIKILGECKYSKI